jgi:hypothetical protein
MKTNLLALLVVSAHPMFSRAQETALNPIDTLLTETVERVLPAPKKDTVNLTDSLGKKQGHWIFFGSDFPNSGVGAYDILEEGTFEDGERTGLWFRYGPDKQIRAVMLFRIDPKTKASVRDQFYNYSYYTNGNLKRKPVIGACRTMSDYYVYTQNGELQEAELFDENCNTTCKIQQIKKGELDSVSILIVDNSFTVSPEVASEHPPTNTISFDQSGEYYVDYNHRIFQVGRFEKGQFLDGREYLFDEMMRAQRVRYYEGGKLVKTVVK